MATENTDGPETVGEPGSHRSADPPTRSFPSRLVEVFSGTLNWRGRSGGRTLYDPFVPFVRFVDNPLQPRHPYRRRHQIRSGQTGQIVCYENRTYRVLPTILAIKLDGHPVMFYICSQ